MFRFNWQEQHTFIKKPILIAGIMGKVARDQSGNSEKNAYEVPCRASILVTPRSLP